MDWDAADAHDVVQALAVHFGFSFAEAVDFLLARQLQQAQNDDGEAQQQHQQQMRRRRWRTRSSGRIVRMNMMV